MRMKYLILHEPDDHGGQEVHALTVADLAVPLDISVQEIGESLFVLAHVGSPYDVHLDYPLAVLHLRKQTLKVLQQIHRRATTRRQPQPQLRYSK
jgi:hypothetical protein